MGLPAEAFWRLTNREFHALQRVQERDDERWAVERAQFANVYRGQDEVAFTPEDFLGRGDRAGRIREKRQSDIEVARINGRLAMLKPGDTSGMPAWAAGLIESQKGN